MALQFHTIVPVRVNGEISEKDVASSAPWFPLAGAFQGFLLSVSAFALTKLFGPYIAGGLAVSVSIIASGGFDLDGLADTADSLAVKSSGDPAADRKKRLDIMKESTIGAIGAVALIISVLMKFLLISGLLEAGYGPEQKQRPAVFALLFLMPAFSKWTTLPAMYHGQPARQDGLGRIFIQNTGLKDVALSTILLTGLYSAIFWLPVFYLKAVPPAACEGFLLLIMVFFYILSVSAARFFMKKYGGLTGDHLGALTELADLFFLMISTLWLRRFIAG